MLADLGAQVIKVERPPDGDYLRTALPLMDVDGQVVSAVFAYLNRGKQSLGLDFSSPRGRQVLLDLACHADVFIESFRPGALNRRGLGYDAVRAVNPGIIYCSLSGYGQSGPFRTRAGHDLNYIALAGILNMNAHRGGPPALPPIQIADLSGGMLAAIQILAALAQRTRTGEGAYLDVSLFDAAVEWMQTIIGSFYRAEHINPRRGDMPLTGAYPCYNIYETADGGYISIAALEPNFWISFCDAVGRRDLIEVQYETAAIEQVAELVRSRTRAEWVEFARHSDVCVEPLLEVSETLAHPQVQARGLAVPNGRRVPRMGEDSVAVLRAVGYTDAQIQELVEAGTIAVP